MSEFRCGRCKAIVDLAENETPWAVYDIIESKELPLCIECVNTCKPSRFSALGGIPYFKWTEPINHYSRLATGEVADQLRREIFGDF